MKNLLCIALITLLLMNTMGCYLVFYAVQVKSDSNLVSQLDLDSYDDSKSTTIKIPVAIPYMPDQAEFQRVDGKFFHEGQIYRTVKQKYSQDTLTIVCIRDTDSEQIHNALTDYVKTFSDHSQDHKSNAKTSVSFIKDFIAIPFSIKNTSEGWNVNVVRNTHYLFSLSSFHASILHPPERA